MVFEILSLVALAPLPLRLGMGAVMVVHGYPKLNGITAKQTRDFLKTVGVPPVLATLMGLLELVGGIALIIGFLTPIAGLLFAVGMLATTFLSKYRLQKKYVPGYELDIAYLAIGLSLFLLGGGPFSVDAFLKL